MINFRYVEYRNFLAAGNNSIRIDFDATNTTLIIGKNGAGKSTITDAITFALYGKAFRNINKPNLINSINQKNMLVEIAFDIGNFRYRVVRGMKPNIFEIYQNDKMLNQDAASRDYQEVLERQILKMSYKTFCQVVILGAASFTSFMGLPAQKKREIIEDILDLEVFSTMNVLLKEKAQNNTTNVKDVDTEIRILDQKIKLQKEHLDIMTKDVNTLIRDLNDKIFNDKQKIEELRIVIQENNSTRENLMEGVEDDPTKLSTRYNKMNSIFDQLNKKVNSIKKEIDFLENNDNCPTCHQDITQEFKCEHIGLKNAAIEDTQDSIHKLDWEMRKTKENMDEINSIFETCSDLNLENTISINSINSLEGSIKNHQKDIDKLKEKRDSFHDEGNSLASLENEKKFYDKQKEKLLSDRELYSTALMMLKDTGIKAKIIKQYIPIINKNLNKYLQAMDFYISFELDENFKETIKSRFRDEFSFESFSEGEKARITLCILFTWRTIAKLRNSASTNLLIFDETMDGSLDADGTEEFLKILKIAAPESNVFVISHKRDAMLDRFDRVLSFDKIKNFSQMSEL